MILLPACAAVIEASNLSKRYGGKIAVDGLTFSVAPGKVTGRRVLAVLRYLRL